jgi:hypothetical protein
MTFSIARSLAATSLVLGLFVLTAAPVQAQGSTTTRAQVKMERDAFLSMVRWDPVIDNWVLKDDMAMPAGVLSRNEVKAMRDKFLSMHTWDDNNGLWVPVKGTPRDMSKLSRDQVKVETVRFLKMYRFDESTSEWVSKNR